MKNISPERRQRRRLWLALPLFLPLSADVKRRDYRAAAAAAATGVDLSLLFSFFVPTPSLWLTPPPTYRSESGLRRKIQVKPLSFQTAR